MKNLPARWRGGYTDLLDLSDTERQLRNLATDATIIEIVGDSTAEDALIFAAVDRAFASGLTSFDLETGPRPEWRHDERAALDAYKAQIVMCQIGDLDQQYIIWWQTISATAKARIKELWCSPDVKKAGVNLKFDQRILFGYEGLDWRGQGILDCQIIEQILCCGVLGTSVGQTMKLTGMGPMMLRWYGIKLVKDEDVRTGWADMTPGVWATTPEEAEAGRIKRYYAADDVCVPILLLQKQLPWIRQFEMVSTLQLEMEFLPELAHMEVLGLPINIEKWTELARAAEAGLAAAEEALDILFDLTVTYRVDLNGKMEIEREQNYASGADLKEMVHDWMLNKYGVHVIATNQHFKDALIAGGANPEFVERRFEKKMVPNPKKPGSQKKVGFPNMNDYVVGSDFVSSNWDLYQRKLPDGAFRLEDSESDTFRLLRIIHEHPRKDEIDPELPTRIGMPPALVDPILALRDNQTKLQRYAWSWIGVPGSGKTGLVHPVTGRIHTDTTQTCADTARLTTTPNFQNLPAIQDYRTAACTARKGYKIVGADLSQIEPRIIFEISGSPLYGKVFWSEFPESEGFKFWCGSDVIETLDLYGSVGAEIGVLPPDAAAKAIAKLAENKEGRDKSKIAVLGLGYGQGPDKFYIGYLLDRGIYLPRDESDQLYHGFWRVAAEVKEALDELSNLADPRKSKRRVYHPLTETYLTYSESLGQRLRFFEPDATNGYTVGRNHPIQCTGAEILKKIVVEVGKGFRALQLDARVLLTAHDELICEALEAHAEQALDLMLKVMSYVGQLYCPHVPITAEGYIADHWTK